MDLGLDGRVVLVTGGSRGIGRAAALAFGREGARVALTFHSDRERAETVVAELRAMGVDAFALPMALDNHESIRTAIATVVDSWSQIDVLVNNAVQWGTRAPWESPSFEEVDPAYWRPLFEVNLEGHYRAIQCVVPGMRKRAWGRIVNVSSGIAADGLPGAGPYGAAKAALHGLTRTLAKELGPIGILTNVVMPGLTLTERNRDRIPAERRDAMARTSPIRRLLTPEEVVLTIVFLGSAANTAIIGEVIRVSGGVS